MNIVRVKREQLLEKVKENRANHASLFTRAAIGFRARAIEELDDMLRQTKAGDPVRLFVGLTPPEDHTNEYDRAIDMLAMSQDDIIEMDRATFGQLVRNEWQWFGNATVVNSTYALGNKIGGSR